MPTRPIDLPVRRIVIALQSARADADKADDWKLQDAFYDALIQALGKKP